jgi:hypothetical protein
MSSNGEIKIWTDGEYKTSIYGDFKSADSSNPGSTWSAGIYGVNPGSNYLYLDEMICANTLDGATPRRDVTTTSTSTTTITTTINPVEEVYNFVVKISGIDDVRDGALVSIFFEECYNYEYFLVKKTSGQISVRKEKQFDPYDIRVSIDCDYYNQIKNKANICPLNRDKFTTELNLDVCDYRCLFNRNYCALEACFGRIDECHPF